MDNGAVVTVELEVRCAFAYTCKARAETSARRHVESFTGTWRRCTRADTREKGPTAAAAAVTRHPVRCRSLASELPSPFPVSSPLSISSHRYVISPLCRR